MSTIRITAIGEILWDIYPERKRLGGAPFNFIYHIWKLLGSANFISSVGNDENGKQILDFLKEKGFPSNYVYIDNEHPTGTVNVKLNSDKTPKFTISKECSYDFIRLDNSAIELINTKTDLLYFGTLSQRGDISRAAHEALYNKNLKYFCDLNLRHDFFSKEMIEKALNVSNVIKINIDELNKIIKLFELNSENKKAIEQIKNNFNIDILCVTLGEDGALLYNGEEFNLYKAESKNIVDTVGAGDAFASILCAGYMKGMHIGKINLLANQFAMDMCGVNGALPENDNIYKKFKREFENDS